MGPQRRRGRRLIHADASSESKPDLSKLIRTRGNHIYFYCPVTEESIIELIIKVHECKDAEARRLEMESKGSDVEEDEEEEDDGSSDHSSASGSEGAIPSKAEKSESPIHMTPLVEPASKDTVQVYIHLFTEVSVRTCRSPYIAVCIEQLALECAFFKACTFSDSASFRREVTCRAESSPTTGFKAY